MGNVPLVNVNAVDHLAATCPAPIPTRTTTATR